MEPQQRVIQTLVRVLADGHLLAAPVEIKTDILIDHLTDDSRKVSPGGLFVAVRGELTDGHLFIDKAVLNGAIALVYEAMPTTVNAVGIACIQVTDSRAALAELAAAWYGYPARHMRMIGVTGTNGKTTTTCLVHHMLMNLGVKTGLIGTIACRIGDKLFETNLTTPGPLVLQQWLSRMQQAGCTACVMEVSSHALAQERTRTLDFQVAAFTNLTHDHLDFHGTAVAYFEAKKRLFDGLSEQAVALYNLDDPAGPGIITDTKARCRSYGTTPAADIQLEVLENRIEGLHLRMDGYEQAFRLVGGFNAYNLAVAYGIGLALAYDPKMVLNVLARAEPVPGRFEQLAFEDSKTVIVDYAHTPDALENVLKTARATKSEEAKLWCIFGCGGDRDVRKRPVMGRIAEQYADVPVVTSDNPRTEDPQAILADIRKGFVQPDRAIWIVERRAAIQYVAREALPGDVVLIAGKGHEPYQDINGIKKHFDDREEAQKWFS